MPTLGEDCCEAVRQYLKANNLISLGKINSVILCEIIDRVEAHRLAAEKARRKAARKAKEGGFQLPTAQEVTDFARSIGFDLDGEAFCAHYESNGWKVGKTRMISWRATVVTWKKNARQFGTHKAPQPRISQKNDLPEPAGWLDWVRVNMPNWIGLTYDVVPAWTRMDRLTQKTISEAMEQAEHAIL